MKYTLALILLKLWIVAEMTLIAAVLYFSGVEVGLDSLLALVLAVAGALAIMFLDPKEAKGKKILMFPISHYLKSRR